MNKKKDEQAHSNDVVPPCGNRLWAVTSVEDGILVSHIHENGYRHDVIGICGFYECNVSKTGTYVVRNPTKEQQDLLNKTICNDCGATLEPCDYSPLYGNSAIHPDNGCRKTGSLIWFGFPKKEGNNEPI